MKKVGLSDWTRRGGISRRDGISRQDGISRWDELLRRDEISSGRDLMSGLVKNVRNEFVVSMKKQGHKRWLSPCPTL